MSSESSLSVSSVFKWDFFISYATEDREVVATPLAEALREKGFKVWYDIFELTPGKPLLRSIDEGLRESRFGLVILSPSFFAKEWPMRELSGLHARSVHQTDQSFLIPIWHNLNATDLAQFSLILSDIVGIPWGLGLDIAVQKILSLLGETEDPHQQNAKVFAEVYHALSSLEYAETIKNTHANYPAMTISSLKSIVMRADIGLEMRIRSLSMLAELGSLDSQVIENILDQRDTEWLREIIRLLTNTNVVLAKSQVKKLFDNPSLPRSTSGLRQMLRKFIERGAGYTSEVFLAGASYPAWEVKYDCVRGIIDADDKDSLLTLAAFSTMKYWVARRRIIEYIHKLIDEGRLAEDNKRIADQILTQIITDGKTELKTPTMRHARETLALLRGKAMDDETTEKAVSILFLIADPSDLSRLRLGEEVREVQEKLQLAKLRSQFELSQRMSVRPVDISQALLDVQPQIVHFSGHGTSVGALCFEDQLGETHLVQPDALAALFEQFSNQVNCVVLNACYSETQANAIAKHIDYVVGMSQAIGDKVAIAFAIGFYQALGAGRTVEEAYKLGCVQIRLQGIPEHLTPVLIKKGQIQP